MHETHKKYGIIVDGYSTGSGLAREFAKYGIECIHIQSQPEIPKVYSHTYTPEDYYEHAIIRNDIHNLALKLKRYNPEFVIAGAECGIELADKLCEILQLRGNGSTLSKNRRNKYSMYELLKAKGINSIPTYRTESLNNLIEWTTLENSWPYVIKPLTSAGGEGVSICKTIDEVVNAYDKIVKNEYNMLGFKNEGVIAQPYISGSEYVINTVSYHGRHKFCELWQYKRFELSDGNQIYDIAEVIDFDELEHGEMIEYAYQILDAFHIQHGPAHLEIIKNRDGCFLIEIGARLMGGNLPFALMAECITTAQTNLTTISYINSIQFEELFNTPYQIKKHLSALFMRSKKFGIIKQINFLEQLSCLDSFHDMKLAVKVGDYLNRTVDYQTSPGMIYLANSNQKSLERDIKFIRDLEPQIFTLI